MYDVAAVSDTLDAAPLSTRKKRKKKKACRRTFPTLFYNPAVARLTSPCLFLLHTPLDRAVFFLYRSLKIRLTCCSPSPSLSLSPTDKVQALRLRRSHAGRRRNRRLHSRLCRPVPAEESTRVERDTSHAKTLSCRQSRERAGMGIL